MNNEEISKALSQSIRAVKMGDLERTPTWKKKWWDFRLWLEDNNPFTKYVEVSSYDEYVKLPRYKRTFLLFWYLRPLFHPTGASALEFLGKKKDRNAIDTYLKYRFPVQYYLREKLYYKAIIAYDKLCYALNPRQKWLIKQIPNEWNDKVTLITDINFAMIVHFVDEEKCFESTDYAGSSPAHAQFARELKECYNYIKIRRPILQEKHQNSYPDEENMTGDYSVDYAETHRLEKEIDDQDTKWLTWIVTNRAFLWT
jgi:hypothetical protein